MRVLATFNKYGNMVGFWSQNIDFIFITFLFTEDDPLWIRVQTFFQPLVCELMQLPAQYVDR